MESQNIIITHIQDHKEPGVWKGWFRAPHAKPRKQLKVNGRLEISSLHVKEKTCNI